MTLDASITGDREGDSTAITKAIQPSLKKYVWREAGLNCDPAIDDDGNFQKLR